MGLTPGRNNCLLKVPMLDLAAQGGPEVQASQGMALPSGDSRFSSSVAATSTSSSSIWQASARAWPVAMTKLASAAKESSRPRTRACREERRLGGSSSRLAFWGPLPMTDCHRPPFGVVCSSVPAPPHLLDQESSSWSLAPVS